MWCAIGASLGDEVGCGGCDGRGIVTVDGDDRVAARLAFSRCTSWHPVVSLGDPRGVLIE
jgi:hypothetical protein